MLKKANKSYLTERDIKILRFIWKWKVLSTLAISRKFFPESISDAAYRRLLDLTRMGFIEPVNINFNRQALWSLTTKGFIRISPFFGELLSKGFKAENSSHDYLVTCFHLGLWLTNQPEYTQTYSEQQLRRISPELWDAWVPSSTVHRPDGYSLLFKNDKKVIISFEVELSIKEKKRYEPLIVFYDSQDTIDLVFWLVERKKDIRTLKNIFENLGMKKPLKHQFVLLENFKKNGWLAPFSHGSFEGQLIANVLFPQGVPRSSLAVPLRDDLALLNTSKKPLISISSTNT